MRSAIRSSTSRWSGEYAVRQSIDLTVTQPPEVEAARTRTEAEIDAEFEAITDELLRRREERRREHAGGTTMPNNGADCTASRRSKPG